MENDESVGEICGRRSMCGRETALIRLPGKHDILFLDCNSDFATADLLIAEIDAATFAGRNANSLVSELKGIGGRILGRA